MQNTCKGQSLVEVILVIGIFAVVATAVVTTLLTSIQATKQGVEYVAAAGYIEEGIESVRSVHRRKYSYQHNFFKQ